MAGDAHVDESQFKGMAKHFNAVTTRGRANVALATYVVVGGLLWYSLSKPKPAAKH